MINIEDTIRDIRKRCRLAMNGITSASMRQYGLNYKLNFGVSLPQIKEIAKHYQQDIGLAETLWKENVRELKIMATILFPIDKFSKEVANKWVHEIPNQEIREQICINLLQKLEYADSLSKELSVSQDESIRSTGYWLLSGLLINKKIVKCELNSYPYIFTDLLESNVTLRSSALLALKNIGKLSEKNAADILRSIQLYKNSDNELEREIYDSLNFEFEFHYD